MAKFLTTQGTSYYLENIIINANKWLVLISPYLNITKNFLLRLQDASGRKVKVMIIYGKNELKSDEKKKIQSLENISLYYCKNLHAKCFLNEVSMVITSMNMYEFSEKTNREMGILIQKDTDTDKKIYEDAVREVKSIIDSSKEDTVTDRLIVPDTRQTRTRKIGIPSKKETKPNSWVKAGEALAGLLGEIAEKKNEAPRGRRRRKGFCIRCGGQVPYDLERPYCRDCFDSWLEWENPSYIEKYCLTCGNRDRSSMLYPQCRSCFKKSQR